jgi:hypothetical protein
VVVVLSEVVVVCDGSLFRYFCISKLSHARVSLSSVPVLAFTAVPFRSCRVIVTACALLFNQLSTELPCSADSCDGVTAIESDSSESQSSQ